MGHLYFIWKEPEREDRVLVWDTQTISIGRAPENDLTLDDDEISRKHAQLSKEDGGFEVGDYRTGNGTFVNGERVSQKRRIQPGDVIRVGKLELALREGDEHPAKLGLRLEFASQLKTVGSVPADADAGATVLGLSDAVAGPDEDFVIEPERASGEQAFVAGADSEFQMKELDDSLDNLDLDLEDGMGLADEIDGPPAAPTEPLDLAPGPDAPGGASDPGGQTAAAADPMERMRKLKTLHEEGLITDEEFQAKRAEILEAM